ncbi:MAG: membrane dipeptidase [Lewinellaceae bacterium]|nr:membrane dipeptidase [Lewinellaceae bacterium]
MKRLHLLSLLIFVNCLVQAQNEYPRSEAKAEKIVASVLRNSPIIDGHNDLFAWYYGCNYKHLPKCPQDIDDYPLDQITAGQTDIPRWRKGGVGGVQINVASDSLSSLLDAYDLLYRLQNTYTSDLEIVRSSYEMGRAMNKGKIALLPMLEGSDALQNKTSLLRTYYKLGLRCVTFTYHTSELADGSDDEPRNNGLSALGREFVQEMNNLGIIIDMSHISAKSMSDILAISKAPVIFSHSNVRKLSDVNRNVPDTILLKLKSNGGLIMIDMVAEHSSMSFSRWMNQGDSLYYAFMKEFPGDNAKLQETMEAWEKKYPMPLVTVSDVADHFDYVKKLIGIDYIGISGDYDGMDYPIPGLEDVSCFPKVLIELAKRGWSKRELKKITCENYLRVFSAIEQKAQKVQQTD